MRAASRVFIILITFAALSSCVGAGADIVMNADGSGRMTLEYRVSRQFEAIGALDGNARWQTVPVGRTDLERSVERLNAVKLLSFSSKEEGPDLVNKAVLSFSRLEDILPLLDFGGGGAALSAEGGRRTLRLRMGGTAASVDPQLLDLAEQVTHGYHIAISVSAPSGVELRFPEGAMGEGVSLEQTGKKAGFSAPLFLFVSRREEVIAEFVF